jgi:hypothetical protein
MSKHERSTSTGKLFKFEQSPADLYNSEIYMVPGTVKELKMLRTIFPKGNTSQIYMKK